MRAAVRAIGAVGIFGRQKYPFLNISFKLMISSSDNFSAITRSSSPFFSIQVLNEMKLKNELPLIYNEIFRCDFLSLDPKDPPYSKVHAILLHPSCSGSGTVAERLDHLLPSHAAGQLANVDETERLTKLASFQKKALTHALYFPQVERIVYSTCSIHQIENEDVVKSILPLAASHGFRLATLAPSWSSVSRRL